jgi:GNAT superfamily N-acetyltransferase
MDRARVVVRPADPADAEAVARIYVESWNEGFGGLLRKREVTPEVVASWRTDLDARPPHHWWIAALEGVPVGFVGVRPSRDPGDAGVGELDTIAVDPSCWRRGAGRGLMATALARMIQDDYSHGILWTLADYQLGRRFYVATGWVADGGTRRGGREISYRHSLSR